MFGTIVAGLIAFAVGANPDAVHLTGVVLDANDQPVAEARIGLAMAAPRVGPALFCPSCYLDCAKSTHTDKDGHFDIEIFDPGLKFQVLCSVTGKATKLSAWHDPATGPLKFKLADVPRDVPPERIVRGKLVDDAGVPIAGALIEPSGAKTDSRRWWGKVDVDPAVSDKDGSFFFLLPANYEGIDLSIDREGYAGTDVELLLPGQEERQIVVPSGTQVVGRLAHAGQPLAGQKVAVVQLERSVQHHFIKAVQATTDAEGKFTFNYLPADERYVIFTPVGVGPSPWALTSKKFTAGGNHKSRDLGVLETVGTLRLAGHVELPEGQTLPKHSKVAVDRDPAWDLISVEIGDDGKFEISGLPPEVYEVRLVAKGFELDPAKIPYQSTGTSKFGVSLNESADDLRIPLQPAAKQ